MEECKDIHCVKRKRPKRRYKKFPLRFIFESGTRRSRTTHSSDRYGTNAPAGVSGEGRNIDFQEEMAATQFNVPSEADLSDMDGIFGNELRDLRDQSRRRLHCKTRWQEEENWRALRPVLLKGHMRFESRRNHQMEERKEFEKMQYIDNVNRETSCTRCAYELCDLISQKEVFVVTHDFCHRLLVPIRRCPRCSTWDPECRSVFHATPPTMCAFPCTPIWPFQLEQVGPDQPVVMFGYELLNQLRETVDFCPRMGINSFSESLYARIVRHSCHIPIRKDSLRKALSRAFNEFTVVQTCMDDPVTHCEALQSPLGECPACAGSQDYLKEIAVKKEEDGASEERQGIARAWQGNVIHSVYVDGHFGIPHMAAAGKSSHKSAPIQKYMFDDEDVARYQSLEASKALGGDAAGPPCSDFRADTVVARTSKTYDKTGVSGMFCRHGIVLALLNMTTGERWGYADMLLEHVLKDKECLVLNFWYDINCRYKVHARKWAEARKEHLGIAASSWVSNSMSFPLGSFHGPMHNALCQSINGLTKVKYAGLGMGEPPEYAWAQMRKSGHILQYMSLGTRALHLERLSLMWNQSRRQIIVQMLVDAYDRAQIKCEDCTCEMQRIVATLMQQGVPEDVIAEVVANTPRVGVEQELNRSVEVEYLETHLVCSFIDSSAKFLEPFVEVLMGDVFSKHLSKNSAYAKRMRTRLQRAKAQLPPGWLESRRDVSKAHLELYALHLRQKQERVIQARQKKHMIEMQIARLNNRRKDFRKLNRHLQECTKALRLEIVWLGKTAQQLTTAAIQYGQRAMENASEDVQSTFVEAINIVRYFDIVNGALEYRRLYALIEEDRYPWRHAGIGGLERMRVLFHSMKDTQSRCVEEMDLLRAEFHGIRGHVAREIQEVDLRLQNLTNVHEDPPPHDPYGDSIDAWRDGIDNVRIGNDSMESTASISALHLHRRNMVDLLVQLDKYSLTSTGVHRVGDEEELNIDGDLELSSEEEYLTADEGDI